MRWIAFHAHYDFAYMMRLLTCKPLPLEEDDFFSQLKLYCPSIYDIKYLMKFCENLKGGLNKVAEDLEVERVGPEHQAGSDSLLTQASFCTRLFHNKSLHSSLSQSVSFTIPLSEGWGGEGGTRAPGGLGFATHAGNRFCTGLFHSSLSKCAGSSPRVGEGWGGKGGSGAPGRLRLATHAGNPLHNHFLFGHALRWKGWD